MDFAMTEQAARKFKEVAAQNGVLGASLRIYIVGGGCSGFNYQMQFDSEPPKSTDRVLNLHGVRIHIDQVSALYLDGASIDYLETAEASGFKFENPNAKRTCGCGSSLFA